MGYIFTTIFNKSLSQGSIPSFWKHAKTSAVPKKGNPVVVNDYRPIDISSIGFNCMQKLLLPYIMKAIIERGDKNQFAYKKGYSCTDAVLTLVHDIVMGLDQKDTTISKVLFLDFSSAFNTVLPNRMIHDLQNFIDDNWLIHWLADFLQGWSRQVKLQKGYSDRTDIFVGVPQGGPLSALLFIIYTDEIRSNPDCTVIKYADDTTISCKISKKSHRKNQTDYQEFINGVVNTCETKNLILNPKKSKEMIFENVNIKHNGLIDSKAEKTYINGESVVRTSNTTYLGVCIDDKLTFTNHVSRILSKVYYIVSTVMYIVPFFPLKIRLKIFTTSILPHMIYAVPVWYHFLHAKDKKRLRSFLSYCSHIFQIDRELLVKNVNDAAKNDFIRITQNVLTSTDHPLHSKLKSMCNKSNYNLRNPAITPKFRTRVFKNSFVYRAAVFNQFETLETLL